MWGHSSCRIVKVTHISIAVAQVSTYIIPHVSLLHSTAFLQQPGAEKLYLLGFQQLIADQTYVWLKESSFCLSVELVESSVNSVFHFLCFVLHFLLDCHSVCSVVSVPEKFLSARKNAALKVVCRQVCLY
jgi:hypothetical protein